MCTHFLLFFVGLYPVVGTICNDCKSFPNGGLGALPPGAQEIWHLKIQNTAKKLNFVVQFHPSHVPNRANDMFAQI